MPKPPLDTETIALIRDRLHTAVLGDVLDLMGHRAQFLPANIRPLLPEIRLVGRAMTVYERDTTDADTNFGKMFDPTVDRLLMIVGVGSIIVVPSPSQCPRWCR